MKMCKSILLIVLVLILAAPVSAATVPVISPQASQYLSFYGAEIEEVSSAEFKVTFTVQGTGTMDKLGVSSITVYRSMDGSNWSIWFTDTTSSGMTITNRSTYRASIYYDGDPGVYYQAKVGFFAEQDGNADSSYVFTNIIQLG